VSEGRREGLGASALKTWWRLNLDLNSDVVVFSSHVDLRSWGQHSSAGFGQASGCGGLVHGWVST